MKSHFKDKRIHENRKFDGNSDETRQLLKELAVMLEPHFSKFGEFDFEDMAFCLLRHYQLAIIPMWCREEELAKIAKLKHQIRQVSETYASLHWFIHVKIQMNATLPLEVVNGAYQPGKEYEFTQDFASDFPPFVADQGLIALANHYKNYLPAIEKTSQELPEGIQYKKRAHEAWRLVDAAASLCRVYADTINVPKALNPSSPFRELLKDLFGLFAIETTPEGAFKGWYLHVDSKSES